MPAPDTITRDTDCPICLNAFQKSDWTYPLCCPTPTCQFNYCVECIVHLQKSAADGYMEASDGSHQLRVQVQCPQCRKKYQCRGTSTSSKYPSDVIVQAVVLLRRAATIQPLLKRNDSQLSSTDLSAKDAFLKQTSLEELKDAVRRLKVYREEVDVLCRQQAKQNGKQIISVVPELDWVLWRPHVPEFAAVAKQTNGQNSNSRKSSSDQTQQEAVNQKPWCDPTLFHGLHELMTVDEQEFVTALMTSRQVESLSQAAHILHGILAMATTRTAPLPSAHASARAAAAVVDIQVLHKIRKRYPLPARMPRCVQLPVYDPATILDGSGGGNDPVLQFIDEAKEKHRDTATLTLSKVKGPAGRVGLRKGDVVTHVNGEFVANRRDYAQQLRNACHSCTAAAGNTTNNKNEEAQFFLLVNADPETAQALYVRAQKMQKEKVTFRGGTTRTTAMRRR